MCSIKTERHKSAEKQNYFVLTKYSVVVIDYHHLDGSGLCGPTTGQVLNIDIHHLNVIDITEVYKYFSIRKKKKGALVLTTWEKRLVWLLAINTL